MVRKKINFDKYKNYKTLKTKKEFYISETIKFLIITVAMNFSYYLIDTYLVINIALGSIITTMVIVILSRNFYFFNYNFYQKDWKFDLKILLEYMQDIELLIKNKEI